MGKIFGKLLREKRLQAGKTMGDLANLLGYKVPYISDVERGRRSPFRFEQIYTIASFIGANTDELLGAAALSRGSFELDAVNVSEHAREVGTALMRGWADLQEEDLKEIARIVGKRAGETGG